MVSTVSISDDKMTINLTHGGADILLEKKVDKEFQKLINEEFGVNVKVKFDGITHIDADSEIYILSIKGLRRKLLSVRL